MCKCCHKFIASDTFYKHKCEGVREAAEPFLLQSCNIHTDALFQNDILNKFQDNEVGSLCRSNDMIKEMGYRIYNKKRHASTNLTIYLLISIWPTRLDMCWQVEFVNTTPDWYRIYKIESGIKHTETYLSWLFIRVYKVYA